VVGKHAVKQSLRLFVAQSVLSVSPKRKTKKKTEIEKHN